MNCRQSFHFFNPKLIIPTPVLHAQGKDGSLMPSEVSTLPSVPPLPSLCLFHTQMTWNWVRWTNSPPVTWHRQEVQPNWTDLSDWGCGVRQPAHVLPLPWWSVTEESKEVDTAEGKGWRLLLKADKFFEKGVEFEEGDGHEERKEWEYACVCVCIKIR